MPASVRLDLARGPNCCSTRRPSCRHLSFGKLTISPRPPTPTFGKVPVAQDMIGMGDGLISLALSRCHAVASVTQAAGGWGTAAADAGRGVAPCIWPAVSAARTRIWNAAPMAVLITSRTSGLTSGAARSPATNGTTRFDLGENSERAMKVSLPANFGWLLRSIATRPRTTTLTLTLSSFV